MLNAKHLREKKLPSNLRKNITRFYLREKCTKTKKALYEKCFFYFLYFFNVVKWEG